MHPTPLGATRPLGWTTDAPASREVGTWMRWEGVAALPAVAPADAAGRHAWRRAWRALLRVRPAPRP